MKSIFIFLLIILISSSQKHQILQHLRFLSPECNNHGYIFKTICFCQSQWTGQNCEIPTTAGWIDEASQCDDLINRLDHLTNISPEFYIDDDDEFPRMTGNSIGEGKAAYGEKGSSWIRMHDVVPNFRIFLEDSLSNIDIDQGSLGNCYLLAALASLANIRNGELIKNAFETKIDNEKHVYVTRWLINGKPRFVSVDDWVPGVDKIPSFAKPTHDNDMWAVILEKSWAKIHGTYMATQGGWHTSVWHALTLAPVFDFYHLKSTTAIEIFKKIKVLVDNEFPIGAATVNTPGSNEAIGHAYSVLGAFEIKLDNGSPQKLIKIYNPWNKEIWDANPWADSSDKWTPFVQKQVPGFVNANDGEFYVTPEDYLKNFGATNWAEIKKDYDVQFQDLAIKMPRYNYIVKFNLKEGNNDDIYFFIDKPETRLLQKCQNPFTISNLKIKGPNGKSYEADVKNIVKIEAAPNGIYTASFSFQRSESYLKYFTVTTYAPNNKIEFIPNDFSTIQNNIKICPNNCTNQGRCNYFNGNCTCYYGFKGNDCSLKDIKECPKNCNNNGICEPKFGKCQCQKGFIGESCEPCSDNHKSCELYAKEKKFCEEKSQYWSFMTERCQKTCGEYGYKVGFENCYKPK